MAFEVHKQAAKDNQVTKTARAYITAVIAAGGAILIYAVAHWHTEDANRFAIFLALFLAAATLKCVVPGVGGTYSPVFFFALLGSSSLSFSEVLTASALAGIVQSIYRPTFRPRPIKVVFNAGNLLISTICAYLIVHRMIPVLRELPEVACLILGAAVFYVVNTGLVSIVLALVEHGSLAAVWKHWCFGSLPYYFIGVLLMGSSNPIMYVIAIVVIPAVLVGALFVKFLPQRDCSKWVSE